MLPHELLNALLKLREALMTLPATKKSITPKNKNEKGNLEVYIAKKIRPSAKNYGPYTYYNVSVRT